MIDDEIKMMRQESVRLSHDRSGMMEKIADNATKIKQNKVLPYLVSKVVEVCHIQKGRREGLTISYWMWMRKFRKEQFIMNIMQRRRNVLSLKHRRDRSAAALRTFE